MQELTVDQTADAIGRGATVVDVREASEFGEGHLPGALNLPMGQLPTRLGEIDRARPVCVVCASGNRSRAMTEVLTAAGFDAANVLGGTSAWIRAGRPVER